MEDEKVWVDPTGHVFGYLRKKDDVFVIDGHIALFRKYINDALKTIDESDIAIDEHFE